MKTKWGGLIWSVYIQLAQPIAFDRSYHCIPGAWHCKRALLHASLFREYQMLMYTC